MLCMANTDLPFRALFFVPPGERKEPLGDQQVTWQHGMRKSTANLAELGVSGLRLSCPKDWSTSWLETLRDMSMDEEPY